MGTLITQFHFLRPEWLIALPAVILIWWVLKRANTPTRWENYLPEAMLKALRVDHVSEQQNLYWLLLVSWLALALAAAGPSWQKQSVPAMQNQSAMVVVLDLSPSMAAQDIKPNRFTRAKYEMLDALNQIEDGQVALVAYAGSAHTVSPLTDDPQTIEALLPALSPQVMPESGSNVEAAIELAEQLLDDAGVSSGEIFLITDGVIAAAATNISKRLRSSRALSILAVGGADPAPIPSEDGGFLRNRKGEIVLAGLNTAELRKLAESTGGRYSALAADDADTRYLVRERIEQLSDQRDNPLSETEFDAWVDMGHLFIILVLPLLALCFRKGVIYCLPLCFLMPLESDAADWRNLFKTKDQQAQAQMQNGDYAAAASAFENKDWASVAHYRAGQYAQTIAQLDGHGDVTSLYNKANALALNGDLEQAIKTYNQVLTQQADHADAAHNKKVLEQLMQNDQQESQQQQPSDDQSQSQDGEQQQTDDQQQSQSQESSESDSEQQQNANNQQQSSDQQQQEGQSQDDTKDLSEQSQRQAEQQAQQKSDPGETDDQEAAQAQPELSEQQAAEGEKQQTNIATSEEQADPLTDSSEQWLRTIQDDPSGLLRRKFEYQAWQRARQQGQRTTQTKPSAEERY